MKQFGQFGNDLDQLVDESQSREELEKQVMDNNYVQEKIEEHRMNSSFHSERSNQPIKAIAYGNTSKPNFYKPPMPHSNNKSVVLSQEEEEVKLTPEKEDQPESIEDIRARIAKQLEGFHNQKQLALAD